VIRRSDDGGKTWTDPRDAKSGLLSPGRYHTSSVPVVVHSGRIWRAFECDTGRREFQAFMMSAPVDADLLDAANWTSSNRLAGDSKWLGGEFRGWLEGNAVVAPDGTVLDVLRCEYRKIGERAAVVHISLDGKIASFNPDTGFIPFPGGCKKFTIRFDEKSKSYWTLSNAPDEAARSSNLTADRLRNTLVLMSSPDALHWTVKSIILHHPDALKHAFQYVDWQFDGADLAAVVRTAFDDENGEAHNFHDANFLIFVRVEGFRKPPAR